MQNNEILNKSYNNLKDLIKKYEEEGQNVVMPKYWEVLPNDTQLELKKIIITALRGITKSKAYFDLETLKRRFDNAIKFKTAANEQLDYFKGSGNKKIDANAILENEESKSATSHNRKLLSAYTNSDAKDEIFTFLVRSELKLILVGDQDPQKGNQMYTTFEIIQAEKSIIENSMGYDDSFILNKKNVDIAIAKKPLMSEEQKIAARECTDKNRFISVVEGTAGAGKSFTMEVVKDAFMSEGYDVMGAALSWNAAGVLRGSAGIKNCQAIESLVSGMKRAEDEGRDYFENDTLLIVDEAGLVGVLHMAEILKHIVRSDKKVKLVLTGDTRQLDPVDAGAALTLIKSVVGSKIINKIRRQFLASHRNAVYALKELRSGHALNYFYEQEAISFCLDNEAVLTKMVIDFLSYKANNEGSSALLLATENNDVITLNNMIRTAYKKLGWVYGYETGDIYVSDGNKKPWKARFAVGDEVVVRSNNKDIPVYEIPVGDERKPIHEKNLEVSKWIQKDSGVFNRNNGKVIAVSPMPNGSYSIVVEMTGDVSGRIVLNTEEYTVGVGKGVTANKAFPVIHNFATTIYASQGQTVDAVFMKDDGRLQFRLAYVGASRHRKSFKIYASVEDLTYRMEKKKNKTLSPEVHRQNLLKENLDYVPKRLPLSLRGYTEYDYLAEMSSKWGSYSENMTVSAYEQSLLNKKKGIKDKDKISMFTLENDTQQETECKIVDCSEPAYKVNVNENDSEEEKRIKQNLLYIAKEMKVISSLEEAKNPSSKENEKLVSWLSSIAKINKLNMTNLELPIGTELYTDPTFKMEDPPMVDYAALGLMDENEKDELLAPKVAFIDGEERRFEDRDRKIKLDQEKMEKKSSIKEKNMYGDNKSMSSIYNIRDRLLKSNENLKETSELEKERDLIDFEEYDRTNNYTNLNKKQGLDKNHIELSIIGNKVMPPKKEIPFEPKVEKDAYINSQGELRFKSLEAIARNNDEQDQYESFNKFVQSFKGIYWDYGPNRQPRMLATDSISIKSRYDFDGQCKVGLGYPPTLLSADPENCKWILVVPDFVSAFTAFRKYFVQLEDANNKRLAGEISEEMFDEQIHKFPNIIWGAKDVDWGMYLSDHPKHVEKMFIVSGKNANEKTMKWAENLQGRLWHELGQPVKIEGKMPENYIEVYNKEPSRIRELEERKRKVKPS